MGLSNSPFDTSSTLMADYVSAQQSVQCKECKVFWTEAKGGECNLYFIVSILF